MTNAVILRYLLFNATDFRIEHHLMTLSVMESQGSPDIDQGWAIVIAFGYFMTKVLLIGISYPSSIFYSAFLEEFEQSPTSTAWPTSLNTFCLCFFGEVANIMISILGCRVTVVIGCVMSSVGLLLTSFSYNLDCITVFYGFLAGVGFCIAFMPSYPMVAFYFRRYRKLVFVSAGVGHAVGVFIFPLLNTFLIERYHWRGMFIILSAVNLNMLVIGATYFMPRSSAENPMNKERLLNENNNAQDKTSDLWIRRVIIYLRESVSLLKNRCYCLFILSYLMYGIGMSAFYTHIGNMALTRGVSGDQAALLSSVVGIAGIVGRLPTAVYTHVLDLDVFGVFVVHFLASGFVTGVLGMVTDLYIMLTCCALFGFFISVCTLQPELAIKIAGPEKVSIGVSYSSLLMSFGAMLGGPLGAWAFELDPTYRSSFLLTGGCLLMSGLMNIPSWVAPRRGRGDGNDASRFVELHLQMSNPTNNDDSEDNNEIA